MSNETEIQVTEVGPGVDPEGADGTLGGYFRVHDRPPAFEGPDGHPYTVSIEVEKVPDLRSPYEGYLVFLRWAENGLGVIGHVETETLWRGTSPDQVRFAAGETPLLTVQGHLFEAVRQRADRLTS
jgi:hypothetical protein